jgi:kynurenine formamidase
MKNRACFKCPVLFLMFCLMIFVLIGRLTSAQEEDLSLWKLFETQIKTSKFVDLTHAFDPSIPHWPGFPPMEAKVIYNYEKDGFLAELFTHVGQYGTHCDPPGHFHKGLRMIDEIPVSEMVLPLAVIDCSRKVQTNPDYQITMADIEAWESKYGKIPEGAFVAMRTDWYKRFPDAEKFFNKDEKGKSHYPGWSREVLQFLFDERGVKAIGHEPVDTDAAVTQKGETFPCESYVLETNRFQIELLANLDKVPEAGALVICSWPKPKGGSGFPARVFAIVPSE